MRGDSLRDLYAKALALMGLALLGGIGALVDYWPAGGLQVPAVAMDAAPVGPSVPTAISVRNLANIDIHIPRRMPASRVARADTGPAVVVPAVTQIAVTSSLPFSQMAGTRVTLPMPPRVTRRLAAPRLVADIPAAEVGLSVPNLLPSFPTGSAISDIAELDAPDGGDGRGFLLGAAEVAKKAGSTIASGTLKAGSTIATGTMKAGAPLVGVARVVGNAFKRLKFF